MWGRAQPVQRSCKSNQTSPTTVPDPEGRTLQSCVLLCLPPRSALDLQPGPRRCDPEARGDQDCTYFKTPVCVKSLGMVPKEQRKNFPLVLSSPQIRSPISNVTAILLPLPAPGEGDTVLQ